jgi:hypothetical protein
MNEEFEDPQKKRTNIRLQTLHRQLFFAQPDGFFSVSVKSAYFVSIKKDRPLFSLQNTPSKKVNGRQYVPRLRLDSFV